MYNINEKPIIMKNFLRLLCLPLLITFTQCCPDKQAHKEPSFISSDYFKGKITSISTTLKNDKIEEKKVYGQGMILLDFGDDDMRYVIFKNRSEDKNTEVFFKVKIENDIAIAYDIKKALNAGEKEVNLVTDYLDYFKLDYHGQFDHNNGQNDNHSKLHRVGRPTVAYNASLDITEFSGEVYESGSASLVTRNFIISGMLDTINLYPVNQVLQHAFYEVYGGGPHPVPQFVELSPVHFHK